jgi:hypothetical protein
MLHRQNKTQEETQEKSESLMSSLWNSVGWFNPVTSLSSTGKKLLALSFLSQIESASGDVCFVSPNDPGGFGLYKLHCANGQEASLLATLSQNCSVITSGCGLSFFLTNTLQFGKSAFGSAVCTLSSVMPAEPCEVQVLNMKVLSGYVPALDGGPIAGLVVGGLAVAGVVGIGVYCRFFRKPKEAAEPNEQTALQTETLQRTPNGTANISAVSNDIYTTFGVSPKDLDHLGFNKKDVDDVVKQLKF